MGNDEVFATIPVVIYVIIGICFLLALVYSIWEVPRNRLKRQRQQPR